MRTKGIVIKTSSFTKDFFKECLESINTTYPIHVVGEDDGFELKGIEEGMKMFDEFVFLSDTCIIHDNSFFDELLSVDGGIEFSPNFLSFLGKYDSSVLKEIGVPKILSKRHGVQLEFEWTAKYMKADKNLKKFHTMLPSDTFIFEEKYGKIRMKNGNKYLTKWKGTWHTDMIKD